MNTPSSFYPLLLWQTYKNRTPVAPAVPLIRSWRERNPAYEYTFFTDDEIDAFMAKHFDSATVAVFRALPIGVMRADMWRYAVLYVNGGVYADLDTECIVPIEHWPYNQHKLLVGLENDTHFCQWCIASDAGHPVLAMVLEMIVARWQSGPDLSHSSITHYLTGPGVWTDAIAKHLHFSGRSAREIYTRFAQQDTSLQMLDEHAFTRDLVMHHFGSNHWSKSNQYVSWVTEEGRLQREHACRPVVTQGWSVLAHGELFELGHTNGARVDINASAALILSYCDGQTSIAQILDKLAHQLSVTQDALRDSVWGSLTQLATTGVLDLNGN